MNHQVQTHIERNTLEHWCWHNSLHGRRSFLLYLNCFPLQWLLVCGSEDILEMISPIFTLGLFIGSLVGGVVSDRWVTVSIYLYSSGHCHGFTDGSHSWTRVWSKYIIFRLGRMTSLLTFTILHLLAGVATAFSPNIYFFIGARFIVAICIRGAGISGAVLCESLSLSLLQNFRITILKHYWLALAHPYCYVIFSDGESYLSFSSGSHCWVPNVSRAGDRRHIGPGDAFARFQRASIDYRCASCLHDCLQMVGTFGKYPNENNLN